MACKNYYKFLSKVSPETKGEVNGNIKVCDAIWKAGSNMLRKFYDTVCETYKQHLCEQLEVTDAYWIGDEVGGCLDINGYYTINMSEIVLLVDNGIGFDEFNEWYEQWTDFDRDNRINLRSWIMGARPGIFKKRENEK